MALATPNQNLKEKLLHLMILSREGDRREGILLRQSKGWFQVSGMGHEALAGFATLLKPSDWLFPYYRDRAMVLARGATQEELALAYLAKAGSSSGGRQMPGHYSSKEHNIFSVCTPTGGGLLPACGAAWGMKLKGTDSVCLATVGDAASRQGEFFEAVAFAIQEKLPVVFVVEDNKYGISTATKKFLPFHLGLIDENAFVKIDGRQVDEVLAAGTQAIEKARKGDGPTLIWADIDRLSSHTSSDDQRIYRSAEDIAEMQDRDPIRLLAEELIRDGVVTESQVQEWQKEATEIVDKAYIWAESQPDPTPDSVMDHLFGTEASASKPPISGGKQTMVQSINATFDRILEDDPNVIFFGEDIEDPKGGVFGLTKGLSAKFPKQVFNSPLAEATIMGVAVGLAAYGLKPVFELQFIDFIAPGWNQITTNMSTLRWRSNGELKCPIVIYAPYGAYLPGGSLWHSQSNEASIAHVPGIKLAIPSTPEDAAGLFWTAIHGDDPTFLLIPKHIFRKNVEVITVAEVPLGKARIARAGSKVTVVTWGNTLELVEPFADSYDLEIIDARSFVPFDFATVAQSLEKTGRLVVIQEDNRNCSFGQSIIADICANPEWFNLLLSPPELVSRADVPIGFNPVLEYAALPDSAQIDAALRRVMS